MVLSRDECDRDHGMRRFLVKAAASCAMSLKLSIGVCGWCALAVGCSDHSGPHVNCPVTPAMELPVNGRVVTYCEMGLSISGPRAFPGGSRKNPVFGIKKT
jgi:hypothetical protein